MAKYSGMIGFAVNVEVEPGAYEDKVIERRYRGDILKNNQRFATTNTTSGDLKITNQFSILGDKFAFDHLSELRYLEWRGNRWIVDSVEIEYPRLIMSIGGLYNGPQTDAPEDTRRN